MLEYEATYKLVTDVLKGSSIPMTPRMIGRHTMVPRSIINAVLHYAQRIEKGYVKTLMSPMNSRRKRPNWVYKAPAPVPV